MNIVFVKHQDSKEYCFEVPNIMLPYIKKNMLVLVSTIKGLEVAETTTDIISGHGAKDIAEKNGAYFPLKPVISFVSPQLKTEIKRQFVKEIAIISNCSDLPF